MNLTEVYIAGPFFNEEQLNAVIDIEIECAKKGVSFFSPRKVGVIANMSREERIANNKDIYESNIREINNACCIIAIIDDHDPGTMFEIGYASAVKKQIISVTNKGYGINVMLSESVDHHTGSAEDAINAFLGNPFDDLKIVADT